MALLVECLQDVHDSQGRGFALVFVLSDRLQLDRQLGDTVDSFRSRVARGAPGPRRRGPLRRAEESRQCLAKALSSAVHAELERCVTVVTTKQKLDRFLLESDSKHRRGWLAPIFKRGRVAVICEECHRAHFHGCATGAAVARLFGDQGRAQPADLVYIGFTGTPSQSALELFGRSESSQTETGETVVGSVHCYHLGEAEAEGVVLDVLANYESVNIEDVSGKCAFILADMQRLAHVYPPDFAAVMKGMVVAFGGPWLRPDPADCNGVRSSLGSPRQLWEVQQLWGPLQSQGSLAKASFEAFRRRVVNNSKPKEVRACSEHRLGGLLSARRLKRQALPALLSGKMVFIDEKVASSLLHQVVPSSRYGGKPKSRRKWISWAGSSRLTAKHSDSAIGRAPLQLEKGDLQWSQPFFSLDEILLKRGFSGRAPLRIRRRERDAVSVCDALSRSKHPTVGCLWSIAQPRSAVWPSPWRPRFAKHEELLGKVAADLVSQTLGGRTARHQKVAAQLEGMVFAESFSKQTLSNQAKHSEADTSEKGVFLQKPPKTL
ncbi:unnamed protein product [Durusdinium trenchii]